MVFFILTLHSKRIIKNHIAFYRDDSLAISKNTIGPEAKQTQEKVSNVIKKNIDIIVVQCNLKITNNLDITLSLNDGSYRPYRKPKE